MLLDLLQFQDHNLNTHPRFTSTWMNYNFSNSLDDLWDDITYTAQDMFMQYGLDGSADSKHSLYLLNKTK